MAQVFHPEVKNSSLKIASRSKIIHKQQLQGCGHLPHIADIYPTLVRTSTPQNRGHLPHITADIYPTFTLYTYNLPITYP